MNFLFIFKNSFFNAGRAFTLVCLGILSPLAWAQSMDLDTRTEQMLGLTFMNYTYIEPGYMQLKANKVGLSWSGTYVVGTSWPDPEAPWFVRTELESFLGNADYDSPISGQLSKTPHLFWEARALVGKDYQMGSQVISPYIGLGYRVLKNNIGYQRNSDYTTLPIGFLHKIKLSDLSTLVTGIEYMALIKAQQWVSLSSQDVTLNQPQGYGLRFSLMKKNKSWSFGPAATYWKFQRSDINGSPPVLEPENNTLEFGLKLQYHH